MTTLSTPAGASDVAAYRAGSLTYTRGGLFALSLWLLWGDFAFSFFESIFGRFIPIYLKEFQASNTLIGIVSGSFAGLVNVLFLPNISRWSDNFRSRFGRRIPFLWVAAPLTVGALIAMGSAPEISHWLLHYHGVVLPAGVTSGAFTLGLISGSVVSYHLFNMVLVNAYNWLIRDVVPLEVMSRFLAWFRIVGTVSGMLFLWLVFPHMLAYRREICLSVGLFYLAAFFLMCWRVREGNYPAVEVAERPRGLLKGYGLYFKECLQVPLYRNFFIANLLVVMALSCAGNFTVLFAKSSLGIGMDGLGRIFAWTAGVSAVAFYPVGWLCDRFSPLRVATASLVVLCLGSAAAYLMVQSREGFFVYSLLFGVPTVGWALAHVAGAMALFPALRFGQFSSGLNVFGCGALVVGNLLIGLLMDGARNDYRIAFLWTALFSALAIVPMWKVIRGWKQHGGPHQYVAPLPGSIGH